MTSTPPVDHNSDYGDFGDPEELEIIDQLLLQTTSVAPLNVTDIEDYEAPHGARIPKTVGNGSQTQVDSEILHEPPPPGGKFVRVLPLPPRLTRSTDLQLIKKLVEARKPRQQEQQQRRRGTGDTSTDEPDNRPPLVRFRKPPKKALSVTDLVSPAWCELQYYYTLSKHGKKKRTPAMKQGTAVHQALEDEVHMTVPVDVTTAEDSWGLRIWNIIQGLRSLRDTGRTRELEVWGIINHRGGGSGGELVNGVIDELSYECPDPKYEENLTRAKSTGAAVDTNDVPADQTSITDYLRVGNTMEENGMRLGEALAPATSLSSLSSSPSIAKSTTTTKTMTTRQEEKWIYITDVKTRATPTLPTGSSLRPTILQLHLYHHMLENLARGNFHLSTLTERYKLEPDATFSDSFLAQLGSLGGQDFSFGATSSQEKEEVDGQGEQQQQVSATQTVSSQDAMDVLLQHNNLALLWEYMMNEFRVTFLLSSSAIHNNHNRGDDDNDGDDTHRPAPDEISSTLSSVVIKSTSTPSPTTTETTVKTRLSPLLTASYIAPTYAHTKTSSSSANPRPSRTSTIGHKSFCFDPALLTSYLDDSLAWWRGEREPRGVELPEAWKCRACDFRDECRWIHERDEAVVKGVRESLDQKKRMKKKKI